jgi:hypothetical protein
MVIGRDHVVVDETESGVALQVPDVVAVPREEIVDAEDLVSVRYQGIAEVGTKEAGAASD